MVAAAFVGDGKGEVFQLGDQPTPGRRARALADGRPAQLTRAHAALTGLPEHDQKRLGVIENWNDGPHQLTYRQVEHTNRLITKALAETRPDGAPSTDHSNP